MFAYTFIVIAFSAASRECSSTSLLICKLREVRQRRRNYPRKENRTENSYHRGEFGN
jgi:hypothetical protein